MLLHDYLTEKTGLDVNLIKEAVLNQRDWEQDMVINDEDSSTVEKALSILKVEEYDHFVSLLDKEMQLQEMEVCHV